MRDDAELSNKMVPELKLLVLECLPSASNKQSSCVHTQLVLLRRLAAEIRQLVTTRDNVLSGGVLRLRRRLRS